MGALPIFRRLALSQDFPATVLARAVLHRIGTLLACAEQAACRPG